MLLNRPAGFVYDLVNHRPIDCEKSGKGLRVPIRLGPCDGTLLMVAERPIGAVRLAGPASVARGSQATLTVDVCDKAGVPVEAVVPVELTIRDPDGRACEFSGAYAAIDGRLEVVLDIAPNDLAGMWEVEAVELASGLRAAAALRVEGPSPWPPGDRKVEKARRLRAAEGLTLPAAVGGAATYYGPEVFLRRDEETPLAAIGGAVDGRSEADLAEHFEFGPAARMRNSAGCPGRAFHRPRGA